MLDAFPDTVFICAHMVGYTVWDQARREIYGKYDNLWTDCSSTRFRVCDEVYVDLIRSFGVEKVLFGTDYPMWNPTDEIQRFLNIGLTEEENKKIFSENARKIFMK